MQDLEESAQVVIERFSLLVRMVIQKNLHRSDDIDLEDIEQEVRIKIWTFLKKGKKVQNLASYIKKVAYSTTIDELRKMMKQRPPGQPESLKRVFSGASQVSSGPLDDFCPETGLESREAKESIRALVDSLSENRRKVLELYLSGMTIEEISASLNWEKPRVRHFFYRGLDDLKARSRCLQGRVAGARLDGCPAGKP
jgi:RNA polymerase sigma factor (sigma-70 family)